MKRQPPGKTRPKRMGEHEGDRRNPGPAIALVNTSRLPITNRRWRAPAVATNGYGSERIGSKKDNLRGERRSSGRRASYRSRYGRLSCTDMKFSRSIQFS